MYHTLSNYFFSHFVSFAIFKAIQNYSFFIVVAALRCDIYNLFR